MTLRYLLDRECLSRTVLLKWMLYTFSQLSSKQSLDNEQHNTRRPCRASPLGFVKGTSKLFELWFRMTLANEYKNIYAYKSL